MFTALRHTQHYVQWVPGTVYLVLKQLECEVVHSPPWGANGLHRDICTFYLQALGGSCLRCISYIATADYIAYNSKFVIMLEVCKYEMVYRWISEVLQNRCQNLFMLSSEISASVVKCRSRRSCADVFVPITLLLGLNFRHNTISVYDTLPSLSVTHCLCLTTYKWLRPGVFNAWPAEPFAVARRPF
jgi:hypothetical protein